MTYLRYPAWKVENTNIVTLISNTPRYPKNSNSGPKLHEGHGCEMGLGWHVPTCHRTNAAAQMQKITSSFTALTKNSKICTLALHNEFSEALFLS